MGTTVGRGQMLSYKQQRVCRSVCAFLCDAAVYTAYFSFFHAVVFLVSLVYLWACGDIDQAPQLCELTARAWQCTKYYWYDIVFAGMLFRIALNRRLENIRKKNEAQQRLECDRKEFHASRQQGGRNRERLLSPQSSEVHPNS